MKNKIAGFAVALLLTLFGPAQVLAQQGQAQKPPLNSAPARAYYQINSKFYYIKKIEDVYPLVPKGQRLYLQGMTKEAQDNKAKYYRGFYLYKPSFTDEFDGVDGEGAYADLTGSAYKWFNGRWAKVDVFVRMHEDGEQANDWRFVSQRFEGMI